MTEVIRVLQERYFLHRAVWMFAVCCMAGFLMESLESFFSMGYVQNRQGLLYGPFTPIYGVGALAFLLFRPVLKKRRWPAVFAATALIGASIEYVWSWAQEMLFGTIFWDYCHFSLHLNGRVNILFTLCWGTLGVFLLRFVYPPFCRFMEALPRRGKGLVTWILILLLLGDITISVFAFSRQKERLYAVAASSPVELFLDKTYPDDWMKERFPHMKLRIN